MRVLRRSLLIKMILFGCILSVLPVAIVGSFSYVRSAKQVQEHVQQGEVELLRQINANVEQGLKTVDHTLGKLADTQVMDDALYSELGPYQFQLYNKLRGEILHLQSFDTKVEEVILVNARQGWMVRNSGIKRLVEHPDREQYLSYLELEHPVSWVLLQKSNFADTISSRSCPYMVSLVRKLPTIPADKYGLAMANIPACSLAEMISGGEEPGEVLVVDKSGQIVAHPDTTQIGSRLSAHEVLGERELTFDESSGQQQIEHDGRGYTLTYYKSGFNDWIYLSLVSIEQLTHESRQIGWLTLMVCLGIIGLSILSVGLVSRNLYTPLHRLVQTIQRLPQTRAERPRSEVQLIEEHIRQLFQSNSQLQHEVQDHAEQVSSLFLHRLFSGELRQTEIGEKLAYFGFAEQVAAWRTMRVLAIQVDTLGNTGYEPKDMELLVYATRNITEEVIAPELRLPAVLLGRSLVVLTGLQVADEHEAEEALHEMTSRLQRLVSDYLKLTVSIGISLPLGEVHQAARAYREAQEALKHRIRLGKGVIIPYSSLGAGKPSMLYEYPVRTEHELIDAIKSADEPEALRGLERWMEEALPPARAPEEYQISLVRLLNRLLITGHEAGVTLRAPGAGQPALYEELLALHVSEEIAEWLRSMLVLPLLRHFGERSRSQDHKLSERIIDLIQHHYDAEFTLEDCAAKLHYNASYLSSVFKKETGYAFSDYLASYRLQMAKQWLTETEMTVKEIAERLRYTNSHNFIRAFRKQEGMTPGQYRSQYSSWQG